MVGKVLAPFGLDGALKVSAVDPDALESARKVRVHPVSARALDTTVASARPHGHGFVVRLAGVDSVEAARALRGAHISASRRSLPALPAGSYRRGDLIGLLVQDERKGELGGVVDVRHYPTCDMLVVGAGKMLVPLLRAYGAKVDVTAGTISVRLPDGFDEPG